MTTAFELGCLSAMEKVAVNSGGGGNGTFTKRRPPDEAANAAKRQGVLDSIAAPFKFMGNVASEIPSVAGGYLNAAGSGLNYAGNAIGNAFKSTGPSFEQQRIINHNNREFGHALPSNAPAVGSKPESILSENNRLYGKPQSPEQRAAQKALEAAGPDVNAQYYENLAKLEAAQNAATGAPEQAAGSPAAAGSMLSSLKNPYVLGGLGAGALGLGGYAAYKAYQNRKKKKRPM